MPLNSTSIRCSSIGASPAQDPWPSARYGSASSREYLITRYGPELASTLSQINRLSATLEEVATKVRLAVHGAEGVEA